MTAHAKFSASGAHRWVSCPGSIALEAGYPDVSSTFAVEGTMAHELAAMILLDYNDLGQHGDKDMRGYVEVYVKSIHDRIEDLEMLGAKVVMFVEYRVNFSQWLGVDFDEGFGTADCVLVAYFGDKIHAEVHDLKYGRGVEVLAENNEQLMLYALGVLAEINVDTFTLVINQPRRGHYSEWSCDKTELLEFADKALTAALDVRFVEAMGSKTQALDDYLKPGEKQCRFCKAAAECPALRREVATEVFGAFDAIDTLDVDIEPAATNTADMLSSAMRKMVMIENWCKAVRETVHNKMLAGENIPGFKLVEGRAGNRAWVDDAQVEEVFKGMRLKKEEMYSFKLISPTSAAKLLEKAAPRKWKTLQPFIMRSDGALVVALLSDKRPAVENVSAVDVFDNIKA